MTDTVIICSFESSLSDIPASKRKDEKYVLEVLRKNPRFTVFEATEHHALARTLEILKHKGLITYPEPCPPFPWMLVEVV